MPSCRLSVTVCGVTSGSEQGLQRRCCPRNQGRLLGELLQPRAWKEFRKGSGSACVKRVASI